MKRLRVYLLCLTFLAPMPVSSQTKTPNTPTDEEIGLLAAQIDRAVAQYKSVLAQGKLLLPDLDGSSFSADSKVLEGLQIAGQMLHKNPQAFNSPAGFEIVTGLDDASRNAALTATAAAVACMKKLSDNDPGDTSALMALVQSAYDASGLIYTVSENAAALYERYVKWLYDFSHEELKMLEKLQGILKEKETTPKHSERGLIENQRAGGA